MSVPCPASRSLTHSLTHSLTRFPRSLSTTAGEVNEKSHRIRDYYHATMEVLRDIYEPDVDAGVGGKDKDIEQGKRKCIVYTGHSLGGGMAEVMGLLTDATQESPHLLGSRRMKRKHPLTGDTPVIAFSAPGGIPVVMKTMLGIGRKGTLTANKAKEDTAMKDMARNFHSMVNYCTCY